MPDPDQICPYGCDEHDFGCAGPKRIYAMASPEDQRRYMIQAIAWSLASAATGIALSFAICFAISRCS